MQDRVLEELRAAGTLEASRLAERIWRRTWEATWHTDIRQAVKALEAEGQVEVIPQAGNTRRIGNLVKWKERMALRDSQPRLL